MNKTDRISVHDQVWWKMRYYQKTRRISDAQLAKDIQVSIRTIKDYDTDPRTVSLEKVENFLYVNNLTLSELIVIC